MHAQPWGAPSQSPAPRPAEPSPSEHPAQGHPAPCSALCTPSAVTLPLARRPGSCLSQPRARGWGPVGQEHRASPTSDQRLSRESPTGWEAGRGLVLGGRMFLLPLASPLFCPVTQLCEAP